MAKTVAVSFEENNIKIVHASMSGNNCDVEKTEVLEYDEFDSYLKREKASEFIVTYDFKEAFHGVITIPQIKSRYQKRVIESELRKLTKLNDLSFIYIPVTGRVVEKRNVLEIFYFAVSNEVIRDIAGKFYEHDKVVKAIYPTVFSAASLVQSKAEGIANMGILGTGREKIVFFTGTRGVTFIRNYESVDEGLSDFDIQNINMTISYCWQNIRMNPSSVMLLGNLSSSAGMTMMPTAPLACLYQEQKIKCSSEQFNQFFLPISSYFASGSSNIISREFRNINMLKSYLVYAALIFILISSFSTLYLLYKGRETLMLRSRIEVAKSRGSDVETVYDEFNERSEYMQNVRPIIEFLNRPSPSLQKLLIDLAEAVGDDMKFNSIQAGTKDGNSYNVILNGMSHAETYASLQQAFDSMTDNLKKFKDISINNKSLDLGQKTFKIELTYRRQG